MKVCTIDAAADQRIAIGTFGILAGYAITCAFTTSYASATGEVLSFSGFVKGVVHQVNEGSIDVKVVSLHDTNAGTSTEVSYKAGSLNSFPTGAGGNFYNIYNNVGVADSLEVYRWSGSVSAGSTETTTIEPVLADIIDNNRFKVGDLVQTLNGAVSGKVVGIFTDKVDIDTASPVSIANTTLVTRYTRNASESTLENDEGLLLNATNTGVDWYEQQTLGLTNSTVFWKSIAPKPGTTTFGAERGARNDEIHVVVVDDKGTVSGVTGNILEKYIGLSKASDGKISPSENIYYKQYLANTSNYIFAGTSDAVTGAKFTSIDGYVLSSGGAIAWGQESNGINFGVVGNKDYSLSNGFDYSSASGGMAVSLSDVLNSYELFRNPAEYNVNFLIAGPDGGSSIFESQAKANRLIDIAESRKDCVATISPTRSSVINVSNTDTQTDNIVTFFDPITSSSYGVFDTGYKYMFDRFNNEFRYVPLNGDIAGLMARTSINNYPWFSPAGASRGTINNAIKLAYNPSQAQRDILYPKRINPVVFSPGAGIILFGDKTALSTASAFDRINVRRLFLTVEDTVSRAAKSQLFEFNDVITRTNFVNIIEPYLRDVKAKRGITDFLVVCDESNNTPDVIDSNQFRADIFIKPNRSINFIGLTFVANRTGISFEEVVGTV